MFMIFIFFYEVDPNTVMCLNPCKSENCVEVKDLMLFENVVLCELCSK